MKCDKSVCAALLKMYYEDVPKDQLPSIFTDVIKKYKGDFDKFTNDLYSKSILVDSTRLYAFLAKPTSK